MKQAKKRVYEITLRLRLSAAYNRPKDWHWPRLLSMLDPGDVEVVSERRVNEDGTPFKQG